jgi:hypothetical protein
MPSALLTAASQARQRSTGGAPPTFSPNSGLEAAQPRAEIGGLRRPRPFMTNSSQNYSRTSFFQSLKHAEETQSSLTPAEENYGSVQGSYA